MARTAKEVASEYCTVAEWVPHDRVQPPAEAVRVLYADGLVQVATHAGGAIYLSSDRTYRYVQPMFWQPIPTEGGLSNG